MQFTQQQQQFNIQFQIGLVQKGKTMRRKISHTIRLRRIHANENDRLTNLQYFLIRLPLGRSKAALYFFASSENASAKIYRVVSFFPVKSRGSRVYAPSSSTLQQRQFPTWILPHFPGELSCHGSWDESLFFLPISAWDILFNVADFSNVGYSL